MLKSRKKIFTIIWLCVLFVVFAAGMEVSAALPEAPKLISATSSTDGKVVLTWEKNSKVDGYRVYRKEEGGRWIGLKTIAGAARVSFTDTKVEPGTVYIYTVRALKKTDSSIIGGYYDQTGISVLTRPRTPEMVSAELYSGKQIKVTWKAVQNASGYRVYRRKENGKAETIVTLMSGIAEHYVDKTTKENAKYTYQVKAFVKKPQRTGAWSGYEKSGVSVIAGLDTPKAQPAVRLGAGWVKVQWQSVKNATRYAVYKMEKDAWVRKANISGLSWVDENAGQSTCSYCIKAYTKNGTKNLYSVKTNPIVCKDKSVSTSVVSKVDYWVGDSRTVQIGTDCNISNKCIAKVGANYYNWYINSAEPSLRRVLMNNPTATVVLNFGVNDVGTNAVELYIARYKQLMHDFPRARILIMSVNPADSKYTWASQWGITYPVMADYIIRFNARMKAEFPRNFVDTYSFLMKTGFDTLDGIHYTAATTQKYYWYLLALI